MNRGPISKDGVPFRAKIVGHDWRGGRNLCIGAEGYDPDSFVVLTCSEAEKHKFPVGTTFDLIESNDLDARSAQVTGTGQRERTTEEQALAQIKIARGAIDQAQETLDAAKAELLAARRAYAKARPLTADERELLAKRVECGGALCCMGQEWLRGQLPPFWADALGGWAYNTLACNEQRPERLQEYADRVRGLKLDELPPGTEEA